MNGKLSPLWSSLVLTGSRMVAALSGLILVWLIAQRGAEELGVFRTLFAFFLIIELLPLLGLQIHFMREIALDPSKIRKLLLHGAVFALGVSGVIELVLLKLAHGDGYSLQISGGLILLTLALPATALYLCAVALLIGQEKGAILGVLQAVETLVRTGLGVVCVLLGGSVLSVITALVAIRWLVLIGYWRALQVPPDPDGWRFEPAFFWQILAQVPVFAGITLFVAITRFAAPLLLPWLLDDQAAGHFAAAYLFVDLAVLLPTALVANLMPRFSLLAKDSPGPLTRAAQEGVKLMALTMIPVAGWVTLLAGPLLALVFRNPEIFLPATAVLQIGIWLCVLMAVDQVLSTTLIACGRQRDDLRSVALGAIATLVMLFSSIAAFGVRGAALGLVAGYTLQVTARFILLTRLLPDFKPLPAVWRPLVATTVMMGIVIWIPRPDWVLAAVTGPVVYLLVLAALGALRPVECEGLGLLLRSTSKT